jgi:hypothetical protein
MLLQQPDPHGRRLRVFPGARAPTERFNDVLVPPPPKKTTLTFNLTFKPFPHKNFNQRMQILT